MKCICDFSQKPDNLVALKAHVEDCIVFGPLREYPHNPVVVWRNGEFTVVTEAEKNERTFEVEFVRPASLQLPNEHIAVEVEEDNVQEEVQEATENVEEVVEAPVAEKPAPKKRAPRKKADSSPK